MWDEGAVIAEKYRLTRRLGQGSAALAFKAENLLVGRVVAIKILRPNLARDPEIRRRFLAEARASARIAHPNVVDVFDLGTTEDGTPFMVMELCDGETLSQIIDERGRVGVSYACDLLAQVLGALDAAHDLGIVHRDLKPDNIMVVHPRPDTPVAKVLDFGIAQGVHSDSISPSEGGLIFGTPEYMAPEQARGEPVDARADLYAAGSMLYEMLTGHVPLEGETVAEVLTALLSRPPPRLREYDAALPPALDALVASALSKEPKGRPRSANDFLIRLSPYTSTGRLPSADGDRGSSLPVPLVNERATPSKPKLELVLDTQPPPPKSK
jgi:serine/threonine-protein kinase